MGGTSTGTVAAAATGRTVTEMRDLLGIYLEDADKNEIIPLTRLQLLNTAQDRVVTLLNRHILDELDASELAAALDDTDGYYDFSGLSIFHNKAIDGIRITDGNFCFKISFNEFIKLENQGFTFTTNDPIYYIRGDYIYVEPFENATTIDIYYQSTPADLSIDPEVNCSLDDNVADIIIGLACENFVDKTDTAARAFANAWKKIEELNELAVSDSPLFAKMRGTFNDFPKRIRSSYNILTDS